MFYREAGDFKTSYRDDAQTFPIAFDRWRYYLVMAVGLGIVPFVINDYWVSAVFLPFLIYAIAALGLNILTGYCGQVSLGTGGFMAVGAYTCYKFMTGLDIWLPVGADGAWVEFALPPLNIFFSVIMGGVVTAAVGTLFGLPSLRIKGFYLAVATLAAQFFLVWLFNKWSWAYSYSASGQISAPERLFLGVAVTGPATQPWATYLFCLFFTVVLAWVARNLTRGPIGRSWMAIRDMDIAAEIIGVNPLRAKLTAFAVSSFYIGIAGALFFAVYLGAVEVGEAFGINKSFLVLFMVIIGGLGSIFGSFAGAAFLVLLPVLLKQGLVDGLGWPTDLTAHLQLMIVGGLIVLFLIAEPHGLAALWRTMKEKLRLWPFPH
jgi:branched-chain amino acid transport system permease protein